MCKYKSVIFPSFLSIAKLYLYTSFFCLSCYTVILCISRSQPTKEVIFILLYEFCRGSFTFFFFSPLFFFQTARSFLIVVLQFYSFTKKDIQKDIIYICLRYLFLCAYIEQNPYLSSFLSIYFYTVNSLCKNQNFIQTQSYGRNVIWKFRKNVKRVNSAFFKCLYLKFCK